MYETDRTTTWTLAPAPAHPFVFGDYFGEVRPPLAALGLDACDAIMSVWSGGEVEARADDTRETYAARGE